MIGEYYFLNAVIQFDRTGMKAAAWIYLVRSGHFFCLDYNICLFGRFNTEVFPHILVGCEGETPKSSLILSPPFKDTDSLPCYVNCMLTTYFF